MQLDIFEKLTRQRIYEARNEARASQPLSMNYIEQVFFNKYRCLGAFYLNLNQFLIDSGRGFSTSDDGFLVL
jgi:hypothetical protein